ncbi:MAG: site-specific DNA-methyltransferase [Spirochaetes bacterium]|nr:site-specific DNA-methyltransferase [Spirochaetota bacterium]
MEQLYPNHPSTNYRNRSGDNLKNGIKKDPNNHSTFSDPAFSNNKFSPIHRWVPWIAGFSKDFVKDSISKCMADKGTILDPFAGVGTTLLESFLTKNDSIGFEINPYAFFACKTKLGCYKLDENELNHEIERFNQFYNKSLLSNYTPKITSPKGFKTRVDFYSPKVLNKVLILLDFIQTIEIEYISELFKLAFSSTMVKYSNYSYEPSLGTRVGSGKQNIQDYNVGEIVIDKLNQFLEDARWLKERITIENRPDSKIINDSFFNYKEHISKNSVDLIITSPPYLNNYHYNRNTRPQLYWLNFVDKPKDMKPLEHQNFGNYWQTVRDKSDIDLIFDSSFIDLEEKLSCLRNINSDKKTYGGKGWANYAASYFNDCYKFSSGIEYTLREGGTALVVIGNSILQGITIPTDEYFAKIAESVGLDFIKIHITRYKRTGNSIIQSDVRGSKAKKGHRLYEAVVELKKL